jgi:hypothetical protein
LPTRIVKDTMQTTAMDMPRQTTLPQELYPPAVGSTPVQNHVSRLQVHVNHTAATGDQQAPTDITQYLDEKGRGAGLPNLQHHAQHTSGWATRSECCEGWTRNPCYSNPERTNDQKRLLPPLCTNRQRVACQSTRTEADLEHDQGICQTHVVHGHDVVLSS